MTRPPGTGAVGLVAHLAARAGHRETVIEHLRALAEDADGEAGTRLYLIHEDAEDPGSFTLYEYFDGPDAVADHNGGAALRALLEAASDVLRDGVTVRQLVPLFGKGLPSPPGR